MSNGVIDYDRNARRKRWTYSKGFVTGTSGYALCRVVDEESFMPSRNEHIRLPGIDLSEEKAKAICLILNAPDTY